MEAVQEQKLAASADVYRITTCLRHSVLANPASIRRYLERSLWKLVGLASERLWLLRSHWQGWLDKADSHDAYLPFAIGFEDALAQQLLPSDKLSRELLFFAHGNKWGRGFVVMALVEVQIVRTLGIPAKLPVSRRNCDDQWSHTKSSANARLSAMPRIIPRRQLRQTPFTWS